MLVSESMALVVVEWTHTTGGYVTLPTLREYTLKCSTQFLVRTTYSYSGAVFEEWLGNY